MPHQNLHAMCYVLCARTGFTLIEILISLGLIGAALGLFAGATQTMLLRRSGDFLSTATSIASEEMEKLRATAFADLPPTATLTHADLARLPQSTLTRTVTDESDSLKKVEVKVIWKERDRDRAFALETWRTSGDR